MHRPTTLVRKHDPELLGNLGYPNPLEIDEKILDGCWATKIYQGLMVVQVNRRLAREIKRAGNGRDHAKMKRGEGVSFNLSR